MYPVSVRRWNKKGVIGMFFFAEYYGKDNKFDFDRFTRHCRFKGNTTNTTTYTPTAEEKEMWALSNELTKKYMPNAERLNNTAADILWDSIGSNQVDFNTLNNRAQNQIAGAIGGMQGLIGSNNAATADANGVLSALSPQFASTANATNAQLASLANGVLPANYQANMERAISSTLENTMGSALNSLGQRGVLNSSVTNQAMNDISKNAADTVAQQYQNNINTVGGLAQQQFGNANNALESQIAASQQQYSNAMGANSANSGLFGGLIDSATSGITTGAAAQEAAQQPAINLWTASLGLSPAGSGALAAVSGKGTTTSTTKNSGGGFFDGVGGVLGGLASGWASTWCFAKDTLVKMADGSAKYIQDIVKGDKVLCPHVDGTESEEEVLEVMQPHHADVYAVTAKDKDGNFHVVLTTSTQPLLCENGKFVTVGNMKLCKILRGGLEIISIEYDEFCKVYDLKVSGENNYYADGFVAKGGTNEW